MRQGTLLASPARSADRARASIMRPTEHDEITCEELDGLLVEAPTLDAGRPRDQTELRLSVVVDVETLHELELRAAAEGTDLEAAAAGALRAGAHAA